MSRVGKPYLFAIVMIVVGGAVGLGLTDLIRAQAQTPGAINALTFEAAAVKMNPQAVRKVTAR